MTADEFNARYPIGTPVVAYPGFRPEDDKNCTRIKTVTTTKAWAPHGTQPPVVMVKDHGAWISLTHIDPTGGAA